MTAHAAGRLFELVESVAMPLASGGVLRPIRPIGAALAGELASLASGLARSDLGDLAQKRGETWRALIATDVEPLLTPDCARLLAALNDLLQCVNPAIGGFFTHSRTARIADDVERLLATIPDARTLGDAMARHATLVGVTRLVRRDTTLAWWTGRAIFVGQPPPPRLRAWPRIRRVRERTTDVDLLSLAERSALAPARYRALLAALLSRSPLTELSLAGRAQPGVVRSAALASLCSIAEGRAVVRRLLEGGSVDVRRAWEQTFGPKK